MADEKPEEPVEVKEAEITGEEYWHLMFLRAEERRHAEAVTHAQQVHQTCIEDLTGFASEIRTAKKLKTSESFSIAQRNGKFFFQIN
jgi:hypothetical protein